VSEGREDSRKLVSSLACSCCEGTFLAFARGQLLGDVPVQYLRCDRCGFVRTENPTWLERAYQRPIATLDVGLLSRCLWLADATEAIALTLPRDSRILDWAGGYGTLTRLLRDEGVDAYHHDPYTENLFAQLWEGNPNEEWDLITMFEVLEHLTDPLEVLEPLSTRSPILLFSTQLLPDPTPQPGAWWYYAPETGQHVSFYSARSLNILAERLGMRLLSNGTNFHCLIKPNALGKTGSMIVSHPRSRRFIKAIMRRFRSSPSFLQSDAEAVRLTLTASNESTSEP